MAGYGQGAAAGLKDVLQRLFLEATLKQKAQSEQARLAEDVRQADMRNVVDTEQLGQGQQRIGLEGQRIGLDRDELGFRQERAGVDDTRYAEQAPARAADIQYKGALTGELLRKPTAEQQDREFTTTRDKTLHGYRVGEIGARSADSVASDWQIVQSVNPQTNETVSVRVNRQTGEAQPVTMPGGLQPGGARQTRLSAGQQDDLATMKTVEDMAKIALNLGNELKWAGVGGMGAGTISQLTMKHLGGGNPKEEVLRNTISNIQGTIAKLRGGTSFTANEQKLLDSYTPTINDSSTTIQAKLTSLQQFIDLKRKNTLSFAGSPVTPEGGSTSGGADAATRAAELLKKYGG